MLASACDGAEASAPDTVGKRELLRIQRPDGSALVIDYQFGTLSDRRLVANLAPNEPAENAQIVCELYLADSSRGHCGRDLRSLAAIDWLADAALHVDSLDPIEIGAGAILESSGYTRSNEHLKLEAG
jgi:hypothetical protein